jgi:AcrR family transcriptional regulator
VPAPIAPQRPSEARDRLLRTATALFYAKGVHAVGIDEIISSAQITRATLYRHFPSKDDLIVEYIRAADRQMREAVASATGRPTSPDSGVRAIAGVVAGQITSPGFRGCAFLNAAAEYPDVDDPIHQAVLTHRSWFFDAVAEQFSRIGGGSREWAEQFVMLRDGAMAEGCLSDPERVSRTFLRAVDGILAATRG